MSAELLQRYDSHPIGWTLRQLSTAGDEETRQTTFVMLTTIAELLCWQGELTKDERDSFHKEATALVMKDQVKH